MENPRITFIVPCYNLAHLLAECVNSILSQTYENFEILIMDDCSPDNTPEVAKSFSDTRVIHVRNKKNLRHLANYNKGIELARGEYIWLISADDKLRRPYILERYVTLMDNHPEIGFAFCSAMGLQDGKENEIVGWAYHGAQDIIFKGSDFLEKLLHSNCVTAPSGMARKECYAKEKFPLDMPYAGDWYLWCLFSIYYDVAYFGEPMVCYRLHNLSMTNHLKEKDHCILAGDDLKVLWRINEKLRAGGLHSLVKKCKEEMVRRYVQEIVGKEVERHEHSPNLEWLDRLLPLCGENQIETREFQASILAELGDYQHGKGNFAFALQCYELAIKRNPMTLGVIAKYVIERSGSPGRKVRRILAGIRGHLAGTS